MADDTALTRSAYLHLLRLHKMVEASGNLLGQVVPDGIDVEGELDLVASGCGTILDADAQGVIIDLRLLSSEAGQLLAFRRGPKIIDISRRRHINSDGTTSAAGIAIDPRKEIETGLAFINRQAARQLQIALEPVTLAVGRVGAHLLAHPTCRRDKFFKGAGRPVPLAADQARKDQQQNPDLASHGSLRGG